MSGTIQAGNLTDGSQTRSMEELLAVAPRAYVVMNTMVTPIVIKSQYNISSVTDHGVGIYRLNFTTVFHDSNYVVNASMGTGLNPGATADNDAYCHLGEHLPESFTLYVESAADASYDRAYVSVVIFN